MQPGGILAVLNDLDAACDRAAYEHWYQTDHMPDRLAVPGFLHARRYRRAEGQGPAATQEFFTFYETTDAGVLRSPAYRARLAAPTPGTVEMMRHFRAMCRSICTVAAEAGSGTAGLAAVIGSPAATALRPDLMPHLACGSVTRLRLWTQAEDLPDNPETTLRPGTDTRLGTILVAEGTSPAAVLSAASQAAAACGLTAAPTLYALLYASPPASPPRQPSSQLRAPPRMIDLHDAPGTLPPGHRVYAIGDIHGCAERLWALHTAIAADLAARPVDNPLLLHVGDYVDRGPDSAGVVARLAAGNPLPGIPTVNLMGNHERTMIDALEGIGPSATDWMISGGREALASWGGDPDSPRNTWPAAVPPGHMDFLRGLALSHRVGTYLFVHAGIRPGVAIEEQSAQDMLTIRNSFLYSEQRFEAVVVHGHTPRMTPEVRFNRIGIDTGAVFGGKLTCAILEDTRIGFLTA